MNDQVSNNLTQEEHDRITEAKDEELVDMVRSTVDQLNLLLDKLERYTVRDSTTT